MKQLTKDTWEMMVLWRMALIKLALLCFGTCCLAIITVLSPVVWISLSGQEKFVVIVGIAGLCSTNLVAILDKTAGQIAKGQPPIGELDEQKENG